MSRNTVRRYLKSPEAMRPRLRPPRGSKLDPYAEHIDRRMAEGWSWRSRRRGGLAETRPQ